MTGRVFTIDGSKFDNFDGFVQEFNRVFCSQVDSTWHGNLNAFNDYLSWPDEKYTLVWRQSGLSRQTLGYGEMIKWLEECVRNCQSSNVGEVQEKLESAKRHEGPTLYDWLVEIIRDNEEFVELRLE